MGWADWINTAAGVVDIASQVADLFGKDAEDDQPPVMLGTVQFTMDDDVVFATNTDPEYGTLLTYSTTSPQPNGQIATVSQVQYLSPVQNPPPENPTNTYNCTSDLSRFMPGGVLSINGVLQDALGNPTTSALSFALRSIAIGATINIVGGITASFGKDPQTGLYTFSIQSTGPTLHSAAVHVKGANGQVFDGNMTFNPNPNPNPDARGLGDGTQDTIDLPPGIELSPTVAELSLVMQVDEGTMRKLMFG